MTRAVFLDRDGTINENAPGKYVLRVEDFTLIEGVPEAIGSLCQAGFEVYVVTNQSAIGRGWLDQEKHDTIMRYLNWRVSEAGGTISGVYLCPHLPDEGCECRKPKTGLIAQALAEHPDIDVGESFLVGDRPEDMQLALNAGLRPIFVLSGHGRHEKEALLEKGLDVEAILADLAEAARHIMEA